MKTLGLCAILTVMNTEFKLTDQQKIAFGELAIKKLNELYPNFPDKMTLNEIGASSMIFSDGHVDNTLVFLFEDFGVDCYIGCHGSNFTDDVHPLYLNYMCEIFGEAYYDKALAYWEKLSVARYSEYQEYKVREVAKLELKLDRERQKIFAKQDSIFNTLNAEHQKLSHFAAPDLPLRDTAQDLNPDRER